MAPAWFTGVKRLAMNGKPLTYKSWLPMSRRECGAGQAGPLSGNRPALGGVAGPPSLEDGGSRCESPAQNAMKINMPISRTDKH